MYGRHTHNRSGTVHIHHTHSHDIISHCRCVLQFKLWYEMYLALLLLCFFLLCFIFDGTRSELLVKNVVWHLQHVFCWLNHIKWQPYLQTYHEKRTAWQWFTIKSFLIDKIQMVVVQKQWFRLIILVCMYANAPPMMIRWWIPADKLFSQEVRCDAMYLVWSKSLSPTAR